MANFLTQLEDILKERKQTLPKDSYTASLFAQGVDRILRKIGEESGEVIIEGKNNDPKALTSEVADLVFHIMVLLVHESLSFNDVIAELEKRHQSSNR